MAENRRILLYRIEEQAKNVIFVVIEDNEKEWAFLNTRAMKKATGYVNEVFKNIREVMRDNWNFAIPSTSQSIEFHKSTNLLKARTLPYSA